MFSNHCRKCKFIIKHDYFKHFFTRCKRMSYLVLKMSRSCKLFVSRNNTAGEQEICIYKKIFVIFYKIFTNIIIISIII